MKWEGTDTDELSRKYPPSAIFGADDLFQKEFEGGFIITRFTFEQQLADGSWEEIDDPRRRLTPVTYYESAIDEENRRLFPGDYINECDQCGYDDCRCDDYEVVCKNCNDSGCAKCYYEWCTKCDNHGCETCDPQNVCPSCKQYCDALYESISKVSGLCQSCEYYASLRECDECGMQLTDSNEGKLCTSCEKKSHDNYRRYYAWWLRAPRVRKFWR